MGAEQYNRYMDLTVAPLSGAAGLAVRGIRSLRVEFEVTRTSTSEPNKASIDIHNLSPTSRGFVQDENQAVILKAGYVDRHGIICAGHLKRVEHSRQGASVLTHLEIKDGGKDLYRVRFNRSYKAGVSKVGVIQDLVAALPNVALGTIAASALQGNTPSRLALNGLARVQLDKLARSWGFEWSVQNGTAQFLDPTGAIASTEPITVLSPTTGLIGSPARTQKGCTFECLLDSTMHPGSKVQIQSALVNGFFKVQSLTQQGDTHAAAGWINSGEAIRL